MSSSNSRPLSSFENKVHAYVRQRESVSTADKAELFDVANIALTHAVLTGLKRDVEAQFIASKARLNEFKTVCDLAADGEMVEVPQILDSRGFATTPAEKHWPDTAYLIVCGREHRWKVRNVRFLALIESALEEVSIKMRVNLYGCVTELLAAIDQHEVQTTTSADLYTTADGVRKRLEAL